MRIVQWILMILGWWSAGFLLSSKIVHCRPIIVMPTTEPRAAVFDPCPKPSYKVWVGSLVAVVAGGAWLYVLAGLKGGVPVAPYLTSVVMSAILGAAVARILCPKPA